MKYPFATKYNGVFYPAFTDIPVDEKEEKEEVKVVESQKKVIETPLCMQKPTEIERLANEEKVVYDIPDMKKTHILRMKQDEIKDFARRLKIENYENKSVNQLKKEMLAMIEHNKKED